ncbi:YqaA family protein [Castellaniella sp.]|uniref:YqaA family protein n=1 Tax=Castellaniella sp. TaxID=1955812 RepID=UPI00356011C5
MELWLHSSIQALLAALALPSVGLPAIFFVSLISATLLPLGSEPAVFAFVQLAPHMFWPAVAVATIGNTLGGAVTYVMGAGAETLWHQWRGAPRQTPAAYPPSDISTSGATPARHSPDQAGGRWHRLGTNWFQRLGPPALLLSWLPIVGDPLCAVAGWLRLPFWRSILYMAIGKCLRYIIMTAALLHSWPWLSGWL